MRYVSTRGQAPVLDFSDTLLTGLARDGGLYLPENWPALPRLASLQGMSYPAVAESVMAPFVADAMDRATFRKLIDRAYDAFDTPEVTPLVPLGENEFMLELFHGPTLAFKDVALQLLGHLFEHVLAARQQRITIVGATSGDTGSAAIASVAGRSNMRIFMLHPRGRVSDIQRKQMTTVADANVVNIAIDGSFDDCQALVKALFNDLAFRDKHGLAAVNSINWARVMPQIVYYVTTALKLGAAQGQTVRFSVPTGNFGDIYAGYAAVQMGLSVDRLIVATNINDILSRAIKAGDYSRGQVQPTLSPSMDIQVSSNFERLLFDLMDRDGDSVRQAMDDFSKTGRLDLSPAQQDQARQMFDAARVDEAETLQTIAAIHKDHGVVVDPHTAVGIAAGRRTRASRVVPLVCLATAHPAKFPDAVIRAIGRAPDMPARLQAVLDKPERCQDLPNEAAALQTLINESDWP